MLPRYRWWQCLARDKDDMLNTVFGYFSKGQCWCPCNEEVRYHSKPASARRWTRRQAAVSYPALIVDGRLRHVSAAIGHRMAWHIVFVRREPDRYVTDQEKQHHGSKDMLMWQGS